MQEGRLLKHEIAFVTGEETIEDLNEHHRAASARFLSPRK